MQIVIFAYSRVLIEKIEIKENLLKNKGCTFTHYPYVSC